MTIQLAVDDGDEPDGDERAPTSTTTASPRSPSGGSPVEVLRQRDFAAYTPEEFDEARRLMADLRLAGALAPLASAPPGAPGPPRRAAHGAARAARRWRAGAPLVRRAVHPAAARSCCCATSSGSMEPYARALVRFLHTAVVGRGRVEAFALGTRLTRITRELSSRDPDEALAAAARRVQSTGRAAPASARACASSTTAGASGAWPGARSWSSCPTAGTAAIPRCSAEQMARLARVAYRVVWVNPLKATPEYAPLARGMAAALPYVDEFVEGHSVAALENLVEVIAR